MGQHVTSDGRRRQVDAGAWQPSTEKAPAVHAKRWSWTASCSASLTAAGMGCKRSALSSARECHSCESVQSLGREGGREGESRGLSQAAGGWTSIHHHHSLTHSLLHRLEFCGGDDSIASARTHKPTTSTPFCTVVGLFRGSGSGCGSVAVPVASSATVQRCKAGCVCRRGTAVGLSWDRGGTRRGAEISYRISIVHGLAALAGRKWSGVEGSGGEWRGVECNGTQYERGFQEISVTPMYSAIAKASRIGIIYMPL